ncbi:hypothetical protein KAZ57_01465 [Patescibacteria group bacterium]|nr:hypothetical protein [Patescibacteria group bacterium]
MKWTNFNELVARHPYWERLIHELAPLPFAGSTLLIREFIRTLVEGIAYRPFESLNLDKGFSIAVRKPGSGFYEHQRIWDATSYAVHFCVGKNRLDRARSVSADEPTVQAVINEIYRWHTDAVNEFPETLDPLVWGFVIKTSSYGGMRGLVSVRYDIYPFPDNYMPQG